ncbi:MAG: DUF2589 domain-containing protein [Promethearchaeota archaeon]
MPNPGDELSSLDFEALIGGPLIAVINAQAQAAISSVNFIKTVGFKEKTGGGVDYDAQETEEPIYVKFKYDKEKPGEPGIYEPHILEVPLLTMLPIPFIRMDTTTIDFNAKITSVQYRKTDTSLKIDASLEAKAGWFFGSAKLKVSSSFKRTTTQGMNVERTYSMNVNVRAVQDEMPAGMERILGILEGAIKSKPETPPSTSTATTTTTTSYT